MNIDISQDCKDKIFIHEFDDDFELARNFQLKHKLPQKAFQILFKQIQANRNSLNNNNQNDPASPIPREPLDPLISHRRNSKHLQDSDRLSTRGLTTQNNQNQWHNQSKIARKTLNTEEDQVNTQRVSRLQDYSPQLLRFAAQNRTEISQDHHTFERSITSASNYNDYNMASNKNATHRTSYEENDSPRNLSSSHRPSMHSLSNRPSTSSRASIKVTSRLYNQSRQKEAYLKSIEKRVINSRPTTQELRQKEEQKECTHAPRINPISELLAANRRKDKKPIQVLLQQEGNLANQKKELIRSKLQKEELQKYTFRPSLNPISQKLVENRPSATYDQTTRRLSQDKYSCNMRASQSSNNFIYDASKQDKPAFHPTLNPISQQIMQNKSPFLKRLKHYEEEKNTRLNQLYKVARRNEVVDSHSGKQLYHPNVKIDEQYLKKRNKDSSKNIGEYLYELGKNKKPPKQQKHELHLNSKSEEIVNSLHFKRIAWLFSELDSDQDGLISATKISIDTIPEDVLEIVMPILFEMEEFNFVLNIEEFREAVEALHKALTSDQKSILYNYKRKKTYPDSQGQYIFRPRTIKA